MRNWGAVTLGRDGSWMAALTPCGSGAPCLRRTSISGGSVSVSATSWIEDHGTIGCGSPAASAAADQHALRVHAQDDHPRHASNSARATAAAANHHAKSNAITNATIAPAPSNGDERREPQAPDHVRLHPTSRKIEPMPTPIRTNITPMKIITIPPIWPEPMKPAIRMSVGFSGS